MKDKVTCTIELEVEMQEFLDKIVKEHNLPNIGKAVRCLVNYARDEPEKHDDIFKAIRCPDC